MLEERARESARAAVELACAAGATGAEATISTSARFHVEARDASIEKLERSEGTSLHLRVFVDGRKATLVTTDLSPAGLDRAVAQAVAQAEYVAFDEYARLPEDFAADVPDLALFDERVAHRDGEARIEDALGLEREIRAADPRVTNSSGSHYTDADSITAIANSEGFLGSYRATRASRSTAPVAVDGEHKRVGQYGTASRRIARLESIDSVARTAVSRAVDLFGARKPPTMRVPVIFERDVAGSVLDDIFAAVNGAHVAVANSWLAGCIGKRIGSEAVTIVDDGRLPGELGSTPFDYEGVATRRTVVFEAGVLRSFLCDTYYARKLGVESTGNSNGSGVGSNNFYLEPGTRSLDELIAATPRGVLVLDTIGFATEHASGTYSRGAKGFYIEGGEIAYPIDEFTIAGNFAEMLSAVDLIADDLQFDGAIVSPSFRVGEMMVSGA